MTIPRKDMERLRRLGQRVAEIAALPVQKQKAEMWRRINGLNPVRPMVTWYMEEFCWPEVLDEAGFQCQSEIGRRYERHLCRLLYQWDNVPDDKVVEATIPYDTVIHSTGIGLDAKIIRSGKTHGGANAFCPVLVEESDMARIHRPEIWVDEAATQQNRETSEEIFGGILRAETKGVGSCLCMYLVARFAGLRGLEQMYVDLVDRPEWVHEVMQRMLDAELFALDQYEKLGLLSLNNGNNCVGTSSLGYTDELPQKDFDGLHVRAKDIWGFSTSQTFASVSPEMHEEFAFRYDRPYLSRFGLNVLGCCEALDGKMAQARTIPNLRMISISEWCDRARAAAELKRDYVMAYKPTAAWFAAPTWNLKRAEQDLRDLLDKTRHCALVIHHNSCSTCLKEPQRIHQWVQMAMRLAEEYA